MFQIVPPKRFKYLLHCASTLKENIYIRMVSHQIITLIIINKQILNNDGKMSIVLHHLENRSLDHLNFWKH